MTRSRQASPGYGPWLAVALSVAVHPSGCSDVAPAQSTLDVAVTDSSDLPLDGPLPERCRRNVVADLKSSAGAFSVEVPVGATSFLLTARSERDGGLAFDSLVSPSGVERLAPGWSASPFGATCLSCPNRTTFAPYSVSLIVPVRPGIAVESGTWEGAIVHVESDPRAPLGLSWSATAVVDEEPVTPLRLWVEVVARDDETLEAFRSAGAEAVVAETFEAAGITVEFEWTSDATLPATASALALGAIVRESKGISVLVVDALTGTDSVTLAGASPLPGPVREGTVVLASTAVLGRGAPSLGRTLAHELGHFLGLYHLTEPGAADIHDPLPDTALADDDNLMHVFGDGVELTAQQIGVVRGHPVLVAPDCL